MQLCRAKDWESVKQTCRSNPEEANLIPVPENFSGNRFYSHNVKRCVKENFFNTSDFETVYYETPLGIACAFTDHDSDELYEVMAALVMACPEQVRASQLIPGHTPLRDAILNPRCDVRTLRLLLDADEMCNKGDNTLSSALLLADRNGHLPVDHLLMSVQLGAAEGPFDLFKEYFKHEAQKRHSSKVEFLPLIRLLTIGSSSDVRKSRLTTVAPNEEAIENTRSRRILEATKFLLKNEPSLILQCSKVTGCSPLHAGLRNFGNYLPLINVLTSRPESKTLLAQRNNFGDLPLHVACSVGVPFEILRVLIESTIAATKPTNLGSAFSTHPLLWSVNDSGYTPIDLEWVRHIEGGQGFYSTRSFYPLEPSGVRKHCFKQDEYYRDLLREAVDKVVKQQGDKGDATNIFGSLLNRISLLVTAASSSIPATSSPTFLHHICKLSALPGPTLPEPLIELFLWIHREQLLLKDPFGMLPMHYALSTPLLKRNTECKGLCMEHLLKLLEMEPLSSQVRSKDGRLPLHLLLDYATPNDDDSSHVNIVPILEALIRYFPDSVDCPDPKTRLDPFLLAARNTSLPLDVTYSLLRHSPSRCAPRASATGI